MQKNAYSNPKWLVKVRSPTFLRSRGSEELAPHNSNRIAIYSRDFSRQVFFKHGDALF